MNAQEYKIKGWVARVLILVVVEDGLREQIL